MAGEILSAVKRAKSRYIDMFRNEPHYLIMGHHTFLQYEFEMKESPMNPGAGGFADHDLVRILGMHVVVDPSVLERLVVTGPAKFTAMQASSSPQWEFIKE